MIKDLFSQRFREERERAGLTQDEIAIVCRNREGEPLSRAAIAQWEKADGTRPNFENLVAAARRLGVSIDYLAGLSEVKMPKISGENVDTEQDDGEVVARQWRQLPPPLRQTVYDLILRMLTTLDGADERQRHQWRHEQ